MGRREVGRRRRDGDGMEDEMQMGLDLMVSDQRKSKRCDKVVTSLECGSGTLAKRDPGTV